ncbi:MAG: ribosome maturation factor RimP [Alphaproteobacteria bacterium]
MPTFTDRIEEMVAPQIESLGLALVRVKLFGGRRQVLQVMIERADGSDVNVDDCAAASRAISPMFDVHDPIDGEYQLEVSSPGIDRPLTRPADFERYAGFVVKVELEEPIDGRRRFRGNLLGLADGGQIHLNVDGAEVMLSLEAISGAKLVLTDELIAAHQDSQVAPAQSDAEPVE